MKNFATLLSTKQWVLSAKNEKYNKKIANKKNK